MIRRTAAVIFTLLATLILLAHAAIPHHHHSSQVCLVNAHCESDSDEHGHKLPLNNHEHDGANDPDDCILKQLVAIPSNQERPDTRSWNIGIDQTDFHWIIACLAGTHPEIPDGRIRFSSTVPFLSSSYSNLICLFIGLRAPPTV